VTTAQAATNEVAILSRVLEPDEVPLSPEAARSILALKFRPRDRARMRELSAKAREGTLTPDEKTEIDSYEKVGHLLSLLKARAKVALQKSI
jgi:hypothetical protein